jgi:CspA family cold shock protein
MHSGCHVGIQSIRKNRWIILDRFQDRFAAAPGSGEEVKVTLKWFDPIKGFGFVSATGFDSDVFLHASAVQRAGSPALYPGAELTCEVGDAQRGKQVLRIIEIHSVGDPNAEEDRGSYRGGDRGDRGPRRDFGDRDRGPRRDFGDRDRGPRRPPQQAQPYIPDGSEKEMNGTLKWFKPQSGFGFASPADGGNDVFVHRSALMRSGLSPDDMQPNTPIKMLVRQAEKGLEAVSVEVAS